MLFEVFKHLGDTFLVVINPAPAFHRSLSSLKLLGGRDLAVLLAQSFSKAHNPYNNSVAEAFNSSLKKEEFYKRKYRSENEFKAAVNGYVIFYNTRRPHASMQYKTPEQVEAG